MTIELVRVVAQTDTRSTSSTIRYHAIRRTQTTIRSKLPRRNLTRGSHTTGATKHCIKSSLPKIAFLFTTHTLHSTRFSSTTHRYDSRQRSKAGVGVGIERRRQKTKMRLSSTCLHAKPELDRVFHHQCITNHHGATYQSNGVQSHY